MTTLAIRLQKMAARFGLDHDEDADALIVEVVAQLALYDAQSDEVRRLREALTNYGKHYVACASAWPASDGSFQKCNCGFAAALGSQP